MADASLTANFETWKQYEEVAMHFNELLIQFRAQVGGGLATLVTLGGYIAEGKIRDARDRSRFLFVTCTSLAFVIALAGCLDLLYYSKMLAVTVQEIVAVEKRLPSVHLSTALRSAVGPYGQCFAGSLYVGAFSALTSVAYVSWARLRAHVRGDAEIKATRG